MQRNILLLFPGMTVMVISLSCGGGSIGGPDDGSDEPGQYPGVPAGPTVTAQVGPAGGTIRTADGGFSMVIPAGALSRTTSITVFPLVNTTPNGFGLSYHIEPTALRLAQPANITLTVSEAELGNVPADWVGMGARDRTGQWFGDTKSTVTVSGATTPPASGSLAASSASASGTARNRVVSVTRVESSDGTWVEYTLFAFWLVTPADTTAEIGSSTILRVLACLREDETANSDGSDLLAGLPICRPSIRQGTWSVNGMVPGHSSVGVVHKDPGSNGAEVLYIAPLTIPSSNPVSVVPSMYWPRRNVTKVFDKPPVMITVVGKDLIGTASGSVTSGLAGLVYDYTAKVTWTRDPGPIIGGVGTYRPRGYVKYTARHRCISALTPDSIPIEPTDATLEITFRDSTWIVDGGGVAPQIRYFDTCARMNSILEFSAALYIAADGASLPVKGTFNYNQGIILTGSFQYLLEGASPTPSLGSVGTFHSDQKGDAARCDSTRVRAASRRGSSTESERLQALITCR